MSGLVTGVFVQVEGMGVSTLKVNCIRLMVPGLAFWLASRLRSRSTARWRSRSVEWFRLKSGASSSSMLL
jgi:hypothetical protein